MTTTAARGLAAVFVARARPEMRTLAAAEPDLEGLLDGALTAARAAHPVIALPADAFVVWLAERAAPAASAREALDALHAADLFVACGCARGDRAALDAAQTLLGAEVARAARRLGAETSVSEEALQSLTAALLVGADGTPGLTRYSGRGSLTGFCRAAVLRTILRLHTRQKRTTPLADTDLADRVAGLRDPEIELIKARYRDEVSDAFRHALAALTRRERTLLRLHLVGALSIDAIGASYRVHRATAARWLADARTRLLDETQRALAERLRLQPAEAESVVRLVRSQIDVSVTKILRDSMK